MVAVVVTGGGCSLIIEVLRSNQPNGQTHTHKHTYRRPHRNNLKKLGCGVCLVEQHSFNLLR